MKIKVIPMLVMVTLLFSCSEEDPEINCDTRAQIDGNCVNASSLGYSRTEQPDGTVEESIQILVDTYTMHLNSYAPVNGQPGTLKYTTLTEGVTYSNSPDDGYAVITGGQISSVGTFTLKITHLDRTEKMISGEFTFEGKGEANYKEFELKFSGRFTDVPL